MRYSTASEQRRVRGNATGQVSRRWNASERAVNHSVENVGERNERSPTLCHKRKQRGRGMRECRGMKVCVCPTAKWNVTQKEQRVTGEAGSR